MGLARRGLMQSFFGHDWELERDPKSTRRELEVNLGYAAAAITHDALVAASYLARGDEWGTTPLAQEDVLPDAFADEYDLPFLWRFAFCAGEVAVALDDPESDVFVRWRPACLGEQFAYWGALTSSLRGSIGGGVGGHRRTVDELTLRVVEHVAARRMGDPTFVGLYGDDPVSALRELTANASANFDRPDVVRDERGYHLEAFAPRDRSAVRWPVFERHEDGPYTFGDIAFYPFGNRALHPYVTYGDDMISMSGHPDWLWTNRPPEFGLGRELGRLRPHLN
jgi:hypothetical protein